MVEPSKENEEPKVEVDPASQDVEMNTDDADKQLAESLATEEEKPKGQSISSMVNAEHVQQIIDMGFSKTVAEKSLFLTQAGVEKAMEWIESHMDDEDFQEELVIVTQEGGAPQQYKLSLEERQAAAMTLQKEIRQKQLLNEKIRARENEANRKKQEKEMHEAKIINDERQHKLAIEQKMAEKKALELRVDEQRRRYELDMRERFGDQWQPDAKKKQEEKKDIQGVDLSKNGLDMVLQLYTEMRCPGVAQTCIKTCNTLLSNLIKDPSNEKFRKVNLENAAIKARIAQVNGGVKILQGVGFVKNDEGTALNIEQGAIDTQVVNTVIKMIQEKIKD